MSQGAVQEVGGYGPPEFAEAEQSRFEIAGEENVRVIHHLQEKGQGA